VARQDVEVVRSALAASADGDVGAFFRFADPAIRLYPRPAEPGVETVYEGLEGMMEYLTNWYSQWDEYDAELVAAEPAGERVLAVVRETGRAGRAGIEVVEEFSHSFLIRDGKAVEWRMYDSHAEAREALGLPPA
jgi:ketosteroid isomerase-like protein